MEGLEGGSRKARERENHRGKRGAEPQRETWGGVYQEDMEGWPTGRDWCIDIRGPFLAARDRMGLGRD